MPIPEAAEKNRHRKSSAYIPVGLRREKYIGVHKNHSKSYGYLKRYRLIITHT